MNERLNFGRLKIERVTLVWRSPRVESAVAGGRRIKSGYRSGFSNRFLLQPRKHYAIEFMDFLQMYVSNSPWILCSGYSVLHSFCIELNFQVIYLE